MSCLSICIKVMVSVLQPNLVCYHHLQVLICNEFKLLTSALLHVKSFRMLHTLTVKRDGRDESCINTLS